MKLTKTLTSKEDQNANFIFTGDFPGYLECRFARRSEEYFISYISPQSGCPLRCKFCFLTTTNQLEYEDASLDQILEQTKTVIDYYLASQPKAKIIHHSFMVRGDPFNSEVILNNGDELVQKLNAISLKNDLLPRVMLSTIFPPKMRDIELVDIFKVEQPNIYYSLYSVDDNFRKKWLPNALPVKQALSKLKNWQDHTNKIPRLHWAFIEGENDSPEDIERIIEVVNSFKLKVDINMVRYNAYSEQEGREPHENHLLNIETLLKTGFPNSKVKIISRISPKIYAACGMFIPKNGIIEEYE